MLLITLFAVASVAPAAAQYPTIPATYLDEWQAAQRQCGENQENMVIVSGRNLKFYEIRFSVHRVRMIDRRSLLLSGIWSEDGKDVATRLRLSLSPDRRRMTIKAWHWASRVVSCR